MKSKMELALLVCYVIVVILSISACSDSLDVKKDYGFTLETMPVQSKITKSETVEIRCALIREGKYAEAKYTIRYFQNEGKGVLTIDDGRMLTPNDRFVLNSDTFRLYYTSLCTDAQSIDIYIEDNFGNINETSFSFTNEAAVSEGMDADKVS